MKDLIDKHMATTLSIKFRLPAIFCVLTRRTTISPSLVSTAMIGSYKLLFSFFLLLQATVLAHGQVMAVSQPKTSIFFLLKCDFCRETDYQRIILR